MGNKSGNFAKRQKYIIFMKYGEPPPPSALLIIYIILVSCPA